MIDLHTHTTASDGSLAPSELVAAAQKAELEAVAITDHDTVSGLEEALEAGQRLGMEVVPGIEMSVVLDTLSFHLLGYYVPTAPKRLCSVLKDMEEKRRTRNVRIVEKLQELGMDIRFEDVIARADGTVGRPHIAAELLEKGYVNSFDDAFIRFLGGRGKAFVPKETVDARKAMALLREEGALSVVAHPGLMPFKLQQLDELLAKLTVEGLQGIEVHYPGHSPRMVEDLADLAKHHGLLITGGSDFHGKPNPDISLGRGRGNLFVPYGLLNRMKDRLKQPAG